MCSCVTIIHEDKYRAKKNYQDDGWDDIDNWIDGGMDIGKAAPLTFADKRKIVFYTRQRKGHVIVKGDMYERQFNAMGGDTWVWRTKLFFLELMRRYDIMSCEC